MLNEIKPSFISLQTVGDAAELLTIKEVTIIGILVFIVVALIAAVTYLFKRVEALNNLRLEDQKGFTKELLQITEKTSNTVQQVNEILKITQRDVR
jgi:hypothetical protein